MNLAEFVCWSVSLNIIKFLLYSWQVGGMAVSVTAMFTVVAAPLAAAATAGAIGTGVYGASRSAQTLVDRGIHEQSVGLKDTEARNCWISAASNVLGIASAKGVAYLTKVTQSGEVLSK